MQALMGDDPAWTTATHVSANFERLHDLLRLSAWQAADEETKLILLKVTNREAEGYLRAKDSELISTDILRYVDRLWLGNSDGKFGLSVQKRIWLKVAQNYTDFGEQVGWHCNSGWLDKSEIDFSSNATPGHLPVLLFPSRLPGNGEVYSFVIGKWRTTLYARRDI